MTDSERITELENKVSSLRDALVGLASGQMLELDNLGNPVVVYGAFTNSTHQNSYSVAQPCNLNPYQHHYRMPSGLCACQDKSWSR